MPHDEYQPGDPAPVSGVYEERNVFGTPTGRDVALAQGETFPAIPRGYPYRSLATHSPAELRAKATHYRRMAGTATTEHAMSGLLKLADRLEALAVERERARR